MRRLQDSYRDPVLLPKASFGERIIRLNRLAEAGFASWDFLPGMRFGESAAWWRDGARRDAPHEGLDLGWFRTRDGRRLALGAGARVPVLWPGEVAAVLPDFLGASVFVAHATPGAGGRRLHSVYGHLAPRAGLAVGDRLGEGDEVGTIADGSGRKSPVPPHLHLTVALVALGAPLGWETLRDPARSTLVDPLPAVLGGGGGSAPPA